MAIVDTNGTARILAVGAPAGAPGESIYQVWLSEGNTGSRSDFLMSQKGGNGTNGTKGVDGAGTVVSLIATSRILPTSAVVLDGQFGGAPANPANPAHINLVAGITALGAEAGTLVTVQNSGDLKDVTGDFAPGDTLFPSTNGTLTRTPPASGWRQAVGKVSAPGRMVINLGPAYAMPESANPLFATPTGGASLFVPRSGGDMTGPLGVRDRSTITSDGDASIQVETLSRPNAYSRKQIISSPNAGNGNDAILRLVRPSDGAFQDFVFRSGEGGTLWTDGNLDPTLLAPKSNPVFSGQAAIAPNARLNFGNNQVSFLSVFDPNAPINGGRLQIRRENPSTATFADIYMEKDTTNQGATPPGDGTSHMIKLRQNVKDTNHNQWPFIVEMELSGQGGQNVGIYSSMRKLLGTRGTTWAFCAENRDLSPNNTTGLVGMEVGMGGRGTDNNNVRVGIDISCAGGYPWDPGDNEIAAGIIIGPNFNNSDWTAGVTSNPYDGVAPVSGRIIVKKGVELKGNMGIGIDMSGLRNTYSDTALALAVGHKFKWTGGAVFGADNTSFIFAHPNILPGNVPQSAAMCYIPALIAGAGMGRIAVYPW